MTDTIQYKGVRITLTQEQLAQIEKQKKTNKYKDYTNIKSFEDACEKLGINSNDVFTISDEQIDIAFKKLRVITEALNDGWQPNWNDNNDKKWRIWLRMDGDFSFSDTYCNDTITCVPSTLLFKSKEIAIYAAKHWIDLYKDYYTYQY